LAYIITWVNPSSPNFVLSDLRLLTWASQTFDGKLQPNQSSQQWVSGSVPWNTWLG